MTVRLPRAAGRRLAGAARFHALALALPLALAWGLSAAPARAADNDGLYGRFDGDLTLHVGAGVAVAKDGPALAARFEAVYLSTAGIYGHYTDALGQGSASVERSIAAGLTIQPLFLGRFASDLEHGPARLDLFLDSLALQVGAFWHVPRGSSLARDPGLELAVALGFPLVADATGPFLDIRGALRLSPAGLQPSLPAAQEDTFDQAALLSITLSWHHVVGVHIVDAGDRVAR